MITVNETPTLCISAVWLSSFEDSAKIASDFGKVAVPLDSLIPHLEKEGFVASEGLLEVHRRQFELGLEG